MESPKDTYEKMKNITNIGDVAYERLFENYLIAGLKGSDKLIDIESTDQEGLLEKKYSGRPFPGMVYTFIHLNDKNLSELENFKTGKSFIFHDYTPILFCTNFDPIRRIIKGINLNMLPNETRVKFFEAYWQQYKDFLNRIEEKTEYNKIAINQKYILLAFLGKNPEVFKKFNNEQQSNFNFAYRSYNLKFIRTFRMLEYEEWKYVPFYNAQQTFKKVNFVRIYKAYYDNLKG